MAPNPTPTARPSVDVEKKRRRRRTRQEIKGNINVRKYSYNSSAFFSCFHSIPATVVVLYIILYFIQDQACQDSLYTSSSIKESKESGWGKV